MTIGIDQPRPVRIGAGDALEYARAVVTHFHEDETDEELAPWLPELEAEDYRGWVVRHRGSIVANYGVYTMDVSLPGGHTVPVAGVTAVGVSQFHRRRGLLTAMTAAALDEAVELGEPVAMLFASESAIYGRYGFGVAAPGVGHRIRRPLVFRDPVDIRMVESVTPRNALEAWPAVYERFRGARPGAVSRSEVLWRRMLLEDPPSSRRGASARRLAQVPGRGYAMYRIKDGVEDGLPGGEVQLIELVATDPVAEAALWQHVCDIDLTTTIHAGLRPPDDVLPELLADRLRAGTRVGEPLYARLLDVAAAFAARAYANPGTVSFEIVDGTRDQSGTYRLEVGADGAEVTRARTEPELTLPIDVAASVWLGGVRATQLLAARRLTEHDPGAAARLDRLVAVDRAPWTPFEF
jgi:predicted acetyltransferase